MFFFSCEGHLSQFQKTKEWNIWGVDVTQALMNTPDDPYTLLILRNQIQHQTLPFILA